MSRVFHVFFVVLLTASVCLSEPGPRVRISAWYWLNAAPKVDWQGDFVTMRNMGFTDVVLCWGIDTAAFVKRRDDSLYAMDAARKAGLGAYVLLWHPEANSLDRDPKYLQVDSANHVLRTFDVFNTEWRNTQWKQFVQKVAGIFGHNPAMAGYVFDDSFEIGGTGTVSYGEYERQRFGHELPRNLKDPFWKEWCEARAQWWEDWARDTNSFIRAVDPDRKHLIYLEDTAGQIVSPKLREAAGVDFLRIARHFDAVGGYIFGGHWDSSPDSGQKMAEQSQKVLNDLRLTLGQKQRIIYTFWVANNSKKGSPPAQYPTADQIRLICEMALRAGVNYLDMYGFRIGDPGSTPEETERGEPGSGPIYPLTGQFPQTFLWDRPEVHDPLGNYLRGLNTK